MNKIITEDVLEGVLEQLCTAAPLVSGANTEKNALTQIENLSFPDEDWKYDAYLDIRDYLESRIQECENIKKMIDEGQRIYTFSMNAPSIDYLSSRPQHGTCFILDSDDEPNGFFELLSARYIESPYSYTGFYELYAKYIDSIPTDKICYILQDNRLNHINY